ncbi:MAG TPA: acyl-CoA dehydrogenase family protein [Marmoricola sp.]
MDFTLDDEQRALRDAARGVLKGYDPERRRTVTSSDPGYDTAVWEQLAQMGLLGLPFAEADGGSGAGPVEVAVVAEEIGRVLAPEPYVAAVALAGGIVAAAGSSEQRASLLGGLSDGSSLLAFAHAGADGTAEPVIQGAAASQIVWQVGDDLFVAPAPSDATAYATYDGGRGARLTFDSASAAPLGAPGAATSAVVRTAVARAQIAACHEALGAMDTALSLTTEYLKTRQQFGVTLNRFQALTFRAADCYTSLELTRSIVTWATMVAAEGTDDEIVEAAARAKLQTARAGRHIGQEAIQLHGGIGMTAEYAVGHYTARLTALNHWLGDASSQITTLASALTTDVLDPLR